MADGSPGPRVPALKLIRASLVLTVTGMAAVAIAMHRADPPRSSVLPAVAVVLAMGAVLLMFIFRERSTRVPREQAASSVIVAWALGESAALFGWTIHLIGAPLMWAIPGTLAFMAAIIGVPIPPDEG